MKDDSRVVFAGRLLIKTAPYFYNSAGVPKRELARTLKAISTNLVEIAESLRFGVLPAPSFAKLRAKTITLIIVGREMVLEEIAEGNRSPVSLLYQISDPVRQWTSAN
jgi:hypothetical protein